MNNVGRTLINLLIIGAVVVAAGRIIDDLARR